MALRPFVKELTSVHKISSASSNDSKGLFAWFRGDFRTEAGSLQFEINYHQSHDFERTFGRTRGKQG